MNNFIENQIRLLSPFCPHIAEELWEKIGMKGFISVAEWPKYEEIKEKKVTINQLSYVL